MLNPDSKIAQLLDLLVNEWNSWPEHKEYYLEELFPKLMADPVASSEGWESELFYEIREELGLEDQQNPPELILKQAQAKLKSLVGHNEKNDVERPKRERQLQKEHKEKARLERASKQRAERKCQEAAQQREKERQKATQQREKERQTLLKSLREYLERDFLTAYDFYQTQCTDHISFAEYENEKINYVQSWARDHLDKNPDSEQAAAIGAVEGDVQVVARAGSGKTTTLVSRALFLQKHCGVAPDEMLLLAFNRKAAEEMQIRLTSYLQSSTPHVMTFHSLANALVHPERILFDEPEGEQSQSRALQDVIDQYRHDPNYYDQIRILMMAYFRADWERIISGGYDRTPEEMLRYRRSLVKESLDGEYMKSFGEKVIADFLFEHDIIYRYERNFWWDGRPYRPDFTIGDNRGIVIEYFGLEGDPDYDARSEEKRNYWRKKPDWRLIEFSPNDLICINSA